ncbi:hypothetical protein [Shinella sp.]|uniref:hypothetical protein n=1 Tax=Shinella sp. TaxID=1870904 RepID=UPI00289ED33C|nr:hypothetical protein [Shinella sp.]
MTHYIVVEGESDAELIRSILPQDMEIDEVVIVPSGRRNSAIPLAKSISLAKRAPVALILEAGTENEEMIRNQELGFEDFVAMLPVSLPPVLILAVPTIQRAIMDPEWEDRLFEFLANDGSRPRPGFAYRP